MTFIRIKKIISALMLSTILLVGIFGFINSIKAQNLIDFKPYGEIPREEGTNSFTPVDPSSIKPFKMQVYDPTGGNVNHTKEGGDPSTEGSIANVVSWILFYIATFFSWLVALLVWVMVFVASYNDILTNPVVISGWSIVRDVANNFFIVILLVIAVGTILRVPNYNRQLLPKLLVMAVLINFSKVFTGILIDFSQILTLWFAGAIKVNGGESGAIILTALGLHKLYAFTKLTSTTTLDWTQAPAGLTPGSAIRVLFFAFILSVVAAVVVAIITIMLVYRIVMLWFLVILSPLAFMLSTFPKGQSYAGMWWSELAKYLVVGPVMLFFLYLSFFSGAIVADDPSGSAYDGTNPAGLDIISQADATNKLGLNDITSGPEGLFNFLIIVGLMVGSLVMGQKTGVAGAQWAGKGVSELTKAAKKYSGADFAGATLYKTPGFAGAQALRAGVAIPGVRQIPILGRMAGQAVDKRQVRLASENAKAAQERITARSGALKVDNMSENEKRLMLKSITTDKVTKLALTQSMMKQGMFKDDDVANRSDNIKFINDAKKMLPPELAATFMDNTKKYNPGLAHDTVYKDGDKFRTDAFVSDVRTGKVKAHEMVEALNESQIEGLDKALIKGNHGKIGEFLLNNVSEKDLGEMNGNLLDDARNKVWAGVDHKTWERNTGNGEITDSGEKMRDKFNKATNFNNIIQSYDKDNDSDIESIRNFVSSNGNDIGKKMKSVTYEFVAGFGDLIKPSQFKDQAPAIQEKLKNSFESVINTISDTDITPANQKQYRSKIKNALMSGAKFNENSIDESLDPSDPAGQRFLNSNKRDILKDIMATSSVKDVESMRSLNSNTIQTRMAAEHLDTNVIKGLSASPDGSLLVRDVVTELKDMQTGLPPDSKLAQKYQKLKDI